MTTHLVTFSDSGMSRARELCIESARLHGALKVHKFVADETQPYIRERGLGYWKWKPEIIQHAMQGSDFSDPMPDGDILIYSDAGVEFINNVNYIIDRMGHNTPQDDVWLFGNNWEHAHWCKADAVEEIWPDAFFQRPTFIQEQAIRKETGQRVVGNLPWWESFGKQCQASVVFFRVSDYSRKFVKEWLDWCLFEGGRLIDDSPSRTPNHPEFREHRHDQAILTTLAYREGIKLHYWPAVYNRGGSPEFVYEKLPEYAGDDYPILFHHHRRRNHEWEQVA